MPYLNYLTLFKLMRTICISYINFNLFCSIENDYDEVGTALNIMIYFVIISTITLEIEHYFYCWM